MKRKRLLVQHILSPYSVLGPSWASGDLVIVKTELFLTSGNLQSGGGDMNLFERISDRQALIPTDLIFQLEETENKQGNPYRYDIIL